MISEKTVAIVEGVTAEAQRIELPPARFEISGRHLANGCLKLQLHKV